MTVVRCGGAPVPPVLINKPRVDVSEIPNRDEITDLLGHLPDSNRLIVCGTDAGFAALLTRAMRAEALTVEFAFVCDAPSPATRAYGLPTGAQAADLGLAGRCIAVPLVRDDTGTALIGSAIINGVDGQPLTGEAYADDEQVFSGEVGRLEIVPDPGGPGVAVTTGQRGFLRRPRRHHARAVQLGTQGAVIERDGVPVRRPVKRASFYRHVDPLLLVQP